MTFRLMSLPLAAFIVITALVTSASPASHSQAEVGGPQLLDTNLTLTTVISGLQLPTTMAFLADGDFLVLEKSSGQVKRVVGNAVQSTVLDLAVNNNSERGLLGIALDPAFASNHFVYLYWTCIAPPGPDPFTPSVETCPDTPVLGADSGVIDAVPLRGNRVDRFVWNGTVLTWDRNLIKLRSFQADGAPTPPGQGDAAQPARGNHDGGVMTFGQDGKLYIFFGDQGRRGWLQNLPCGPTATCPGPVMQDDQFGGPQPDNAHLSGVILRLNGDGTVPSDNPFFAAGATIGGEVGANIQKVFSYGHRNSFGLAKDPVSGALWLQENGDDSFSELNRVSAGENGGWIQVAGPASRVAQYREIETTFGGQTLQQLRWPPTNIATSPNDALARLFMLPGAHYDDPEFSWKWEVAPGGIGFLTSSALGPQYANDLFMGAATPNLQGGYLFHFNLTGNRQKIGVDDPRLADRVADNLAKHEITESESLLFGRDFGVVTSIVTGPNGHLYVVSLSRGAVYEIARR